MCVTTGNDYETTVEWTAEANVQYYILIGDRLPSSDGAFELTLQSRGPVQLPTSPVNVNPEPAPSPPDTNDEEPTPKEPPASAPTPNTNEEEPVPENTPNVAPETSPTSEAGACDILFGAHFALFIVSLTLA